MEVELEKTFNEIPHVTENTSIPAAIKFWEIYLKDQEKSVYTIKAFLGDLGLLIKFLPPDTAIGQITTADLNHFIEWLENGRGRNISCSPKSLARRITTLKSFFRWLFEHGRIPIDPAEKIVQRSVISPLPTVLTEEEINNAIDASDTFRFMEKSDARPAALLRILLETGMKKSECLNLKRSHLEMENQNPYVYIRYADAKDRNKERKISLSEECVLVLQEYISQYAPEDALFPWSPRRLEYILEDIGKAARLDQHISFSMCRWNSALIDWKSGQEKNKIRQKLGISKIQWREICSKLEKLHAQT